MRNIWHEETYASLMDELLALMMKFEICYALPHKKDHYIAPQLLSVQPPNYDLTLTTAEREKKSLELRYKYEEFMPRGILTRFIVAMHFLIVNNQLVWRTGVVLEENGTRAEVVEFYHRREIRIHVTGKNARDLLTIISFQLDELNQVFHNLKYDKLIPCNCTTCQSLDVPNFYPLDMLKMRLDHDVDIVECDIPPFNNVEINSLLENIGVATQTEELSNLLRLLVTAFNIEEFRAICVELGINYDDLKGEVLKDKKRDLLLLLALKKRLPEFIDLLRRKRPNQDWSLNP